MVRSLNKHKFEAYLKGDVTFEEFQEKESNGTLCYLLKVYVDDFMSLIIPATKEEMLHVATTVMSGIQDVFPEAKDDNNNPISFKKLKKGESQLSTRKTLLGFDFDGNKKMWWLKHEKDKLLHTLHQWLQLSRKQNSGIPFNEFLLVISKIRHAFAALPAGNGLMLPCNLILQLQPAQVYLHNNEDLRMAIKGICTLLQQSKIELMQCCELVAGWPNFVGVKDASSRGVGGIIIGEVSKCTPTVFWFAWPDDVTKAIVSQSNPARTITNSDLEMAGLLMLFVIMEHVCGPLVKKHVTLFSNNSPSLGWVKCLASCQSIIAAHLIQTLALWLKANKYCPLMPQHMWNQKCYDRHTVTFVWERTKMAFQN